MESYLSSPLLLELQVVPVEVRFFRTKPLLGGIQRITHLANCGETTRQCQGSEIEQPITISLSRTVKMRKLLKATDLIFEY